MGKCSVSISRDKGILRQSMLIGPSVTLTSIGPALRQWTTLPANSVVTSSLPGSSSSRYAMQQVALPYAPYFLAVDVKYRHRRIGAGAQPLFRGLFNVIKFSPPTPMLVLHLRTMSSSLRDLLPSRRSRITK